MLIELPKVAQSSGYLISPKALARLGWRGVCVKILYTSNIAIKGKTAAMTRNGKAHTSGGYQEQEQLQSHEEYIYIYI